jgi:hypothetical protein
MADLVALDFPVLQEVNQHLLMALIQRVSVDPNFEDENCANLTTG